MGRRPCCAKVGLNKGAWSAKEDRILTNYIKVHGEGKWRDLPQRAGLKRCGKSCRLRWLNYLRPGIKRGNISEEEEELIVRLHKLLGNRWSLIAGRLPGRTDNEIKNHWNTCLGKKFQDNNNQDPNQIKATKLEGKRLKKNQQQGLLKPVVAHQVVRTKAVKCTKVIIPQWDDIQLTGCINSLTSRPDSDGPASSANGFADFDIEGLLSASDNTMNLGIHPVNLLQDHEKYSINEPNDNKYCEAQGVSYSLDGLMLKNQQEAVLNDDMWMATDHSQSGCTFDFNALELFLSNV